MYVILERKVSYYSLSSDMDRFQIGGFGTKQDSDMVLALYVMVWEP